MSYQLSLHISLYSPYHLTSLHNTHCTQDFMTSTMSCVTPCTYNHTYCSNIITIKGFMYSRTTIIWTPECQLNHKSLQISEFISINEAHWITLIEHTPVIKYCNEAYSCNRTDTPYWSNNQGFGHTVAIKGLCTELNFNNKMHSCFCVTWILSIYCNCML